MATGDRSAGTSHIPELDAFRGLAALGVVFFHAFPSVFFLGWSFVDLFFVLSGYLITSVILRYREHEAFFTAFYWRRALRIWPVYYVVFAGVLAANAVSSLGYPTEAWWQYATFTQYVQRYWLAAPPPFVSAFSPSWSVAVEEQFYVVWPVVLRWLGPRRVLPLAVFLVAMGVAGRWAGWHHDLLLSRPDGLVFGSLLAICLVTRSTVTDRRLCHAFGWGGAAAAAAVAVMGIVFWGNPEPQWRPVSFTIVAAFYACGVGLAVVRSGHPWLRPLRSPWLATLGLVSYPLYLTHLPVMHYTPVLLARAGITSGALHSAVTWIGVFAAAAVLHWFVERPAFALKARWPYAGVRERHDVRATTVVAAVPSR
ncbi:MAG TPA: acyltransferase [Vicinamibacterales bacterium]|nr:acyltransferase [Vicinamibacterales bacterium]